MTVADLTDFFKNHDPVEFAQGSEKYENGKKRFMELK